jgi:hypothetical protein
MQKKEEFFALVCDAQKNCTSCANTSGCSWCPAKRSCIKHELLKANDQDCNPSNVMFSALSCPTPMKTDMDPVDDILFAPVISDRDKPPNVYLTNDVGYSLETVMAEIQHRCGSSQTSL